MSVIDGKGDSIGLAHAIRSYIRIKPSEIESTTLYGCHPGSVLSCLQNRGYKKVGEETVDGYLCDIYEGKSSRDGKWGTERIWHPRSLGDIYWLKAVLQLTDGRVIEGRLSGIQAETLDPELFKIPADYKELKIPTH
jgi:hypothetical protein